LTNPVLSAILGASDRQGDTLMKISKEEVLVLTILFGIAIGWFGYAKKERNLERTRESKCKSYGGYYVAEQCWALMEPIEIK